MQAEWEKNDRLLVMLFIAGLFHALLILGIRFELPKPREDRKALDIVLVKSPSPKAPEKSDYLAPDHQIGGGEAKEKSVPRTAHPHKRGILEDLRQPVTELEQVPAASNSTPKAVLKQAKSEKKVFTERHDGEVDRAETEHPRLTAETLSKQIAEVSTDLNKSSLDQARQTRIVYINSVNAHRFKAAAYEAAWQEKVERIGNLNYPDAARRNNLSGSLILAVGIKQDGSVYSIKVRQSSGEAVLDDAAQRIVRISSPFAPFPEELKQEADVLVITRTWRFSVDNRVETGH